MTQGQRPKKTHTGRKLYAALAFYWAIWPLTMELGRRKSGGRIQNLGEYRQSRPRRSPDGLFGAKKLLRPTHFGQEKHRIDLRGLLVPQLLDAPKSGFAGLVPEMSNLGTLRIVFALIGLAGLAGMPIVLRRSKMRSIVTYAFALVFLATPPILGVVLFSISGHPADFYGFLAPTAIVGLLLVPDTGQPACDTPSGED
jgi:hypothetical protein